MAMADPPTVDRIAELRKSLSRNLHRATSVLAQGISGTSMGILGLNSFFREHRGDWFLPPPARTNLNSYPRTTYT